MKTRAHALAAFALSTAVLVAAAVAIMLAGSSGVGTDLEQVTTARAESAQAVSRGPSRPAVASDNAISAPDEPAIDVPVVDATEIVIEEPVAPPQQMVIDSLRVTMPIIATGVADDGQMELPDDPFVLGWYRFGPSPGDEAGSTVLAGHVDSVEKGVGPLARLASATIGEQIEVTGADGQPVTYRVTDVQRIVKAALPLDTIFRPDGEHQLVVVTCGGAYIEEAGGYEDNIVVTAAPVDA